MSDATTNSIIKVLTSIVDKTISTDKPKTTNLVLLHKAGSTLTPINLGQVSY
jgi:hypothetical protein